jgi:hypothetical protein
MAEIVTGNVTGYVSMWPEKMDAAISDVRREGAEHTNEIVKEGLKGDFNTRGDIKDARYDVNNRITNSTDRIVDSIVAHDAKVADRFFTVGRDTMDLRAQVVQAISEVKAQTELNALKTQLAVKDDGNQTRALINELKNADLNRMLIERNAEIVEERGHGRHWRSHYDQSQWAALNNQLQAFQSQLQETRQGMVNFGTMAGVGQSSTSNNVR